MWCMKGVVHGFILYELFIINGLECSKGKEKSKNNICFIESYLISCV